MERRTEPDVHAIDATDVQIEWLNKIADISQRYRTNVTWLKKWSEQALEATPAVTDIDHQIFSKVQQLNGELSGLLAMRSFIFPPVAEEGKDRSEQAARVSGWVILARKGNPNGLLGMNWFVKEKKEG
jgi:hypothetical protein